MLLHFMNQSKVSTLKSVEQPDPDFAPVVHELESRIAESCEMVSTSYGVFKSRAAEQVTFAEICIYIIWFYYVYKCLFW